MQDPGQDGAARGLTDALLLGLGSLLGALLGFFSLRLLLGALSEADYGRYGWFVAAAGLLGVGVTWPAPAALRLGAEEARAAGRLGRTATTLLLLVLASALPIGAGAWLLADRIELGAGAGAWPWLLALVITGGAAGVFQELLKPAGLVRLRTLVPALARAATLGLLLLVVARQGGLVPGDVYPLMAAGTAVGLLVPAAALLPRLRGPGLAAEDLSRAVRFGGPVLLRLLGLAGLASVDVLVLRELCGPIDVARYAVAYQVAEQVVVLGFTLEHAAGPLLAARAAAADEATAARYLRLVVPQLAWAWALGAALLVPLAGPILALLGAPSPAVSVPLLQLLAVGVALRGVTLLENPLLDAHLLSGWPTVFLLLALAVNAGLDLALVGPLGVFGPAVATVAAFALQALLRGLYLRRRFGVAAGWRPHLGVAAPLLVLAGQRALGGGVEVGLLVWAGALVAALLAGRALGLFPAEARPLLERVRMPGLLRRGLLWIHEAPR